MFIKIFVWMSSRRRSLNKSTSKARYSSVFPVVNLSNLSLGCLLLILVTGCSTTRQVAVVDRVQHDTLYMNKIQYDSIYRNDSFLMDYHPSKEFIYLFDSVLVMKVDTMYIRDKKVEYKYKYLRDTTYIHKVDTIPVIQQVEVVKTEKYIPPWIKWLATFGAIALLLLVLMILRKLKVI